MSPERFRIGGFGVDLSTIANVELRAILHRASAMVNEYCTVPEGHDFRGGSVVDEEIPYRIGHELLPAQRRLYTRHTPLRSLTDLRIDVTNSQYLALSEDEVYITDNYLEITSLSTTGFGLFGAAIIPTIGLVDPIARASYTYGWVYPVIGEELEQTDARLYRAMNQWWWDDPAPAVKVSGAEVTTGFSIDLDEGTVLFDSAPGGKVTVDYAHRLPTAIAEAAGMVAVDRLGERNLTRKGLHGLVELAVGEVRIRRDFPRAGVQKIGVSDQVAQLLDPYRFITVRGGSY